MHTRILSTLAAVVLLLSAANLWASEPQTLVVSVDNTGVKARLEPQAWGRWVLTLPQGRQFAVLNRTNDGWVQIFHDGWYVWVAEQDIALTARARQDPAVPASVSASTSEHSTANALYFGLAAVLVSICTFTWGYVGDRHQDAWLRYRLHA